MARALMIQGTMSNVGKSLLAAGLCRIFKQDGFRVAPFKSQNMALNSYITEDGLEMGRAQVVQAEAAQIRPDVAMNPILLKPTTDMGSQVIVNGTPIGEMKAREYFAYKKALIPEIQKAYAHLEEQYDIIVIEGAGSPAEINLKQDDIVNMGMARMAKAPVLLTGDIDRGGVFAQLYGTVALLEPWERQLVKGLIVNKFRGDPSILEPGIRQLEELCKIPVAGVVPYMDVQIQDEDSLSRRFTGPPYFRGRSTMGVPEGLGTEGGLLLQAGHSSVVVDIAVIRFPKIANFTDLDVFTLLEGVGVRYVSRMEELGEPDLIVLPGTKNTIADLLWMRQNGLEAAVLKLADRQVPIWGICGGYQILGEWLEDPLGGEGRCGWLEDPLGVEGRRGGLEDPLGVEGRRGGLEDPLGVEGRRGRLEGGRPGQESGVRGMGLLPTRTVFAAEKTRAQVEGAFTEVEGIFRELSGKAFSGYEIHMGHTWIDRENGPADTARSFHGQLEICRPLAYLLEPHSGSKQMHQEGWGRGNVYGSYVHGVFDGDGIVETVVDALRKEKGLPALGVGRLDYQAYKESQYERLAAGLRESLDMAMIYKILETGIL